MRNGAIFRPSVISRSEIFSPDNTFVTNTSGIADKLKTLPVLLDADVASSVKEGPIGGDCVLVCLFVCGCVVVVVLISN